MHIHELNDKKITLTTIGIEKSHSANTIEYEDSTITFMIFTYPSMKVIYVLNNEAHNTYIPQVEEKVNKICTFDRSKALKFEKFLESKTKDNNEEIFYFPPMFFREAFFLIKDKYFLEKLDILYDKYKKDFKKNISYPSI